MLTKKTINKTKFIFTFDDVTPELSWPKIICHSKDSPLRRTIDVYILSKLF